MFYYLKGNLVHKDERFAVLDVGGAGYRVYTSLENLTKMKLNEEVTLYTYMNIREDLMELYGFLTQEELSFFELMITVSGVGPKAAISILSTLTVNEIVQAIISNDPKTLSRAQGVGAKIAQRIILELRDKVGKMSYDAEEAITAPSREGKAEATSALIALGYTDKEARAAIGSVSDGLDTESIVKEALKKLMR